jgi:mono/diheme cytochrome c family protein
MPYWSLHRLTESDADAIVAYLRSVPGVDHTVPANEAPWADPEHIAPMSDAEALSVTATATGTTQASADRGRYLANFGCVDCHTPVTAPGSARPLDFSKAFQGGRDFPIGAPFPDVVYTSNLTPHATGLAGYTIADIVKVLREGKDKDGKGVCPPMPSALMGPLQGITEADATDIANYLVNLPPADNMIPMACVSPLP